MGSAEEEELEIGHEAVEHGVNAEFFKLINLIVFYMEPHKPRKSEGPMASESRSDGEYAKKPGSTAVVNPPNVDQSVSPPSGQENSLHTISDR